MNFPISPILFSLSILCGMLILLELGRRWGLRRGSQESEDQRASLGTIEGAVFALFGLLIAFTFSGAALRFNEKRMLTADEANTIDTAYLRLHLVPEQEQITLRALFRNYVDSRLEIYRRLPDMKAAKEEMARSNELQDRIWSQAVAATRLPGAHVDAGKLLLPALNSMIDITTTRTTALQVHPPIIVYGLLFGLALLCSLMAGYRMGDGQGRSWVHILIFTSMTALVVYVILDVEYPRAGLIRLQSADQVLIDVRQRMEAGVPSRAATTP